ncbi:Aldo/keto reductase protein [Marine Group I thaumarchaeote SCGC AAA799-O18]|nr:Aldo/keto reductase protein [Marine Group I thaumarchaeote SCGC AAA799-O18]
MGLDCIDLMYLHNAVEGQPQIPHDEFISQLKRVFEFYEVQRKKQNIRFYGLATWECFRVSKENSNFLSLTQVIDLAKQVGGSTHGFRFIQLPYNLQFDQAYMQKNQTINSNEMSILELAEQSGIGVFTSVPLMQGKLLEWIKNKPEFTHQSPAVNALQFIRSTPGVLAPLIGQKSDSHVKENLEILEIPPFSEEEFNTLLKKLVQ